MTNDATTADLTFETTSGQDIAVTANTSAGRDFLAGRCGFGAVGCTVEAAWVDVWASAAYSSRLRVEFRNGVTAPTIVDVHATR